MQFLRFALVGVAGFVVDAGALYLSMEWLGAGLYVGRVISFLVAATTTWALNRRYTFASSANSGLLGEWAKFLSANAIGGLLNYSVYATLVACSGKIAAMPVLGVAAGSIAGLAVNFTLSRKLVFNRTAQRH